MIYIIGDSHVSVFSGTDKTHDGLRHIQPEFGTCYTLYGTYLKFCTVLMCILLPGTFVWYFLNFDGILTSLHAHMLF